MVHPTDPNEHTFIVFADDWGEHPSSCQHIFKHIADQYKVLWVNTIGMRNPIFSATDINKIFIKVRKMFHQESAQSTQTRPSFLTVCQPPMLPFSNIKLVRQINKYLVVNSVRKAQKRAGISSPIIVTTVPNACDYIGSFGERKVVYYCVDDFSEWPGLNKKLVIDMENKLVMKSDVFIATSKKLFNHLNKYGKLTFLLTHGVDVEFFQNLPKTEHPLLKDIPRPRVGYYGLFDDRSDKQLLEEVAKRLPNVSFVITGKVETDISQLKRLKNFYFTGPVPYAELPGIIAGWDICMLPYKVNELTNAMQPLKLKEYLATGKPVISTPIAEVVAVAPALCVAGTSLDWRGTINSLLNGSKNRKRKASLQYLKGESWVEKSAVFLKIVRADSIRP